MSSNVERKYTDIPSSNSQPNNGPSTTKLTNKKGFYYTVSSPFRRMWNSQRDTKLITLIALAILALPILSYHSSLNDIFINKSIALSIGAGAGILIALMVLGIVTRVKKQQTPPLVQHTADVPAVEQPVAEQAKKLKWKDVLIVLLALGILAGVAYGAVQLKEYGFMKAIHTAGDSLKWFGSYLGSQFALYDAVITGTVLGAATVGLAIILVKLGKQQREMDELTAADLQT